MATGVAALALYSTSAACSSHAEVALHIKVGMTVSEFLAQEGAAQREISLSVSEPDFWGTDDPILLKVDLPGGTLDLPQSGNLGVVVHSSPNSLLNSTNSVSRIRSFSAPIIGGRIDIALGYDAMVSFCKNLRTKLGNMYQSQTEHFDYLADYHSHNKSKIISVCSYRAEDGFVSVEARPDFAGNYYPRVYFSEQ